MPEELEGTPLAHHRVLCINRRNLKWAATLLTLLTLATLIASRWYYISYDHDDRQTGGGGIALLAGVVAVSWFSFDGQRTSSWPPDGLGYGRLSPPALFWQPLMESTNNAATSGMIRSRVHIPLWVPFTLLLFPTAYLWYTDRRAKVWQCQTCRYDLRNLTTTTCPECGHRTPA